MRTRYAIVSTAVTLFAERGYDETTVAEIAEAAEVAPHTFFRYFATKDEVALALITEDDEAIFPALEARPAEEPPVTAFANAARTVGARTAGIPRWRSCGTRRPCAPAPPGPGAE